MKIEVDIDQFESLVANWLREAIKEMDPDSGDWVPMYSMNREEDEKKVNQLKKAMKRVHNYITPHSEHI